MADRPSTAVRLATHAALSHTGCTWVLGIDGRSGAGKTTLAGHVDRELVRRSAGLPVDVVHLEDLYRGWDGLQEGLDQARTLLGDVRRGRVGEVDTWDWHAGRLGPPLRLAPGGFVILEGCGAGSDTLADVVDSLVWIEVPDAQRRRRAFARDGAWQEFWEVWSAQEEAVLARRDARAAADLVVRG